MVVSLRFRVGGSLRSIAESRAWTFATEPSHSSRTSRRLAGDRPGYSEDSIASLTSVLSSSRVASVRISRDTSEWASLISLVGSSSDLEVRGLLRETKLSMSEKWLTIQKKASTRCHIIDQRGGDRDVIMNSHGWRIAMKQ